MNRWEHMRMEEPRARLESIWRTRSARLLTLARLAGLAGLLWGVHHQLVVQPGDARWAIVLLTVSTAVGWVGWMAARSLGAPVAVVWSFLALLAASGGALAGYAPFALSFVAIASLGAGIAFDTAGALGIGAIGVCLVLVSVLALGTTSPGEIIAEAALCAVAGVMVGSSRRQYVARTEQAELLLAERMRADAERDTAAALAERNRLGREVHDVLAHSLGALSVQLDAADAVLEQGEDSERARDLVRQARQLAVRGLEETRQAVHALRDDPVELAEQLTSLAEREGAQVTVTGQPHRLAPDAGLALYRVAQEALTNARKHAPGATVCISLDFNDDATVLAVVNGPGTVDDESGALRRSGGGFGLRGMRERVEVVGGQVRAEPTRSGFTVRAAVPA
jgi:signal transduction histidine kinase